MDPVAVTAASLTTNVVTLTVASVATLRVGYTVTVQGVDSLAQPHFDGTHTLTGVITTTVGDVTTYTVTYAKNHANIAEFDCAGYVTPVCEWITETDVEVFLGFEPDAQADIDYLAACVEAANDWCAQRRAANDYTDLMNHVPNASVKQGTVLYAASMWRERGSVDSFSSFAEQPIPGALAGSMGQISRLLGLVRARVA